MTIPRGIPRPQHLCPCSASHLSPLTFSPWTTQLPSIGALCPLTPSSSSNAAAHDDAQLTDGLPNAEACSAHVLVVFPFFLSTYRFGRSAETRFSEYRFNKIHATRWMRSGCTCGRIFGTVCMLRTSSMGHMRRGKTGAHYTNIYWL